MTVATFSMNSKMVIGLRSNDHLMFFSYIHWSIVCDANHIHCDLIKIYHKFESFSMFLDLIEVMFGVLLDIHWTHNVLDSLDSLVEIREGMLGVLLHVHWACQ